MTDDTKPDAPPGAQAFGCITTILLFAGMYWMVDDLTTCEPNSPKTAAAVKESGGSSKTNVCVISKNAPLFATQAGFKEWQKAIALEDSPAAIVAFNANNAVAIDAGTRCSFLERTIMSGTRIRLIDGAQAGRAGWTLTSLTYEH